MYEDDKVSISWFKIGLRLVIVILIILLSVKLISIVIHNSTNVKESNEMHESLKLMDKVANDYFKDDKLPANIGDNNKVLLEDLVKEDLIKDIKDSNGKKCDYKKSYIKITKLDKQYQIKSNLVCGDKKDYYNSFKDINSNQTLNVETTTTTKKTSPILETTTSKVNKTTTVVTTTKVQTTTKKVVVKKKFTVSFNSNGGSYVDEQAVIENGTIKNVIPVREGYTFIGWFLHGNKFDVSTKINQDYVLTAKWALN